MEMTPITLCQENNNLGINLINTWKLEPLLKESEFKL